MSTPAEIALERYCDQAWNMHQLRHGSNAGAAALAPTPWLAGEQGRIQTSDDEAVLEGRLQADDQVQVRYGQLQLARILIDAGGEGGFHHEFDLWVGAKDPQRTEIEIWSTPIEGETVAPLQEHPGIAADLIGSVGAVFRRAHLTPGEAEVMRQVIGGDSERFIAASSGQARRTVRTLHQHAEQKLRALTLPRAEGDSRVRQFKSRDQRAAALSPGPRAGARDLP